MKASKKVLLPFVLAAVLPSSFVWGEAAEELSAEEAVVEEAVDVSSEETAGDAAEDVSPEEAVAEDTSSGEAVAEDAVDVSSEEAGAPDASAEAPSVESITLDNAVVTTLKVGENDVLVYYPTPNATDTLGVSTTCTAPAFMVFGDSAFDPESADAFAAETGLGTIAADEGASICFVNPVSDSWSEADAAVYEGLVGMINDSSTNTVENGISTGVDFLSGQTTFGVMATAGRIYVYGVDSGADFVAANLIKPVISSVTYPDGFTMTFDRSATSVTVSGLTDVSAIEENDLPVISIGNSDEINQALEEVCGSLLVEETADYAAEYAQVAGQYRRQAGVLLPIHNYEEEGIVQTIETINVPTSPDNVTFAGQEEHPVNYVTYYAENLDVKEGNVPLVLCFHGGGNTALYEAQATEWPEIGKENGFITVSVDLHYPNCSAAEIVYLIEQLKEEYSIDPSRIYASGFSMGGCKSWDLFEQYPEVFAGLAPMDASNAPAVDSFNNPVENTNTDVLVPLFYVAGETSPLPEMPNQDARLIDRVKDVFAVNKVTTEYDVNFDEQDTWANPIWGISGELSYGVTDTVFTDSTLAVELFPSEDGKYYTALTSASNQSHEVYARNSWAAWDFLSQFSRAEDGSIVIDPVTYTLPSDDGAVIDNSYNQ